MIEIAHVAIARSSSECEASHHTVAFQGPTETAFRAPFGQITDGDARRGLEVVARRLRGQVHGAAQGVAAVQGSLRSAHYLDALDIEEVGEGHRWPGEVYAIEIHRRAWIGTGKYSIGADSTDGELTEGGVLRERDQRRLCRGFVDGTNGETRQG